MLHFRHPLYTISNLPWLSVVSVVETPFEPFLAFFSEDLLVALPLSLLVVLCIFVRDPLDLRDL